MTVRSQKTDFAGGPVSRLAPTEGRVPLRSRLEDEVAHAWSFYGQKVWCEVGYGF